VETVFVGRDRLYYRRFLQMCGHYLVDPVACTPASGCEKGQVENQVGLVRERFFTPRLRFKTYDELNAWLLDQCIAYAKRKSVEQALAAARLSDPEAVRDSIQISSSSWPLVQPFSESLRHAMEGRSVRAASRLQRAESPLRRAFEMADLAAFL
jgi:hypothetical protein